MTNLSPTEIRMASFIDDYWRVNISPPCIRELMQLTEISSTSSVLYILKNLRKKGYLEPARKGWSRQIIPTWVKTAIAEFSNGAEQETKSPEG